MSEHFPYRLIVDELRAEIIDGQRLPGSRMPSENELAAHYQTSRPTVRRALAVLKAEGLLSSEQGRGVFVRPTPHVRLLVTGANFRKHRALGLPGFNAQALEQGQRPEQRIRSVATIGASAEVAIRLNVGEDSPVVVRRRVFLVEGQPAALCDSYYPADMAAGTAIERPERIRGGVYALIEDPQGPIQRQITRSVDELVARMPTHQEAVDLQLPSGVPVVRVLRTVFDSDDVPVEVQDSVVAADRHEFRYEERMR
ncbi:MAG TPA: GntR family transcriptional regulator [Streptosporangiaceae bacterium]|nr:GntR family transcriptional regulator [Streptosporangiaceae bacterium]